jgi:N utilization substance protein B
VGREAALQALYAYDVGAKGTKSLNSFWDNFRDEQEASTFARDIAEGVIANIPAIDRAIESASKNWTMARMSKVDLNILRLAVYELLFRDDIPKNVTINEAIEVAKKYGAEDSPSFINGILDEVATTVSKE